MELFVDDARMQEELPTAGSLEDTVRFIQRDVCPAGRLVIRLRCNGEEIAENQMANALGKPATSCTKLEVFTDTPGKLVATAMQQAASALSDSERASTDAARLLTEGDSKGGIAALGECIGVWQQIHEAVAKSIQMLELDPDATFVNELSLADAIAKPSEVLIQIKKALESQDHVLLADVLNYELRQATDLWKAVVNQMHTEAVRKSEPD